MRLTCTIAATCLSPSGCTLTLTIETAPARSRLPLPESSVPPGQAGSALMDPLPRRPPLEELTETDESFLSDRSIPLTFHLPDSLDRPWLGRGKPAGSGNTGVVQPFGVHELAGLKPEAVPSPHGSEPCGPDSRAGGSGTEGCGEAGEPARSEFQDGGESPEDFLPGDPPDALPEARDTLPDDPEAAADGAMRNTGVPEAIQACGTALPAGQAELANGGGDLPDRRPAPRSPGLLKRSEIARMVSDFRVRHSISRKTMGEMAGVSDNTIRNVELGHSCLPSTIDCVLWVIGYTAGNVQNAGLPMRLRRPSQDARP